MTKIPSFFKVRKAKQFELYTRYYDKRKERIELSKEIRESKKSSLNKGNLKNIWGQKNKSYDKKSSLILFIIIIILIGLTYFIIKI